MTLSSLLLLFEMSLALISSSFLLLFGKSLDFVSSLEGFEIVLVFGGNREAMISISSELELSITSCYIDCWSPFYFIFLGAEFISYCEEVAAVSFLASTFYSNLTMAALIVRISYLS